MSFSSLLARLSDMFGAAGQGIPFANRNGFVDGAFESVSGTVTTLPAGAQYSQCQMWLAQAGLGGAGTASFTSLRALPTYQAVMDSGPNNAAYITLSTASTGTFAGGNLPAFWQRAEWVNKYAGKSVTLSFKLWVSSGSCTIPGVLCGQNFGTGGSPTAAVGFNKAVNWVVSGGIKKFSVRVDVPAAPSGVVYGTNNNDFTNFGIWLPAGWTGTLFIAEPQLELCNPNASSDLNGNGGAPTAFEYRGYGPEAERVRRFYRVLPGNGASYMGMTPGTTVAYAFGVADTTTMRATPAAALTGTWVCTAPAGNTGTVAVNSSTNEPLFLQCTGGPAYTTGQTCYFGSTNNGTITLDARL